MGCACREPWWCTQSPVNLLRQFVPTMIQDSSEVLFPQCATNVSLYIFSLISLALIWRVLKRYVYFYILLLIAYTQTISGGVPHVGEVIPEP